MSADQGNSVFLYQYKGRDYKLKFTFNTICDMEEQMRLDLASIMAMGFSGIRVVVFYGLSHYKGMTKAKAGDILEWIKTDIPDNENFNDESGVDYISNVVRSVLSKGGFIAIEEEDEEEEEESEIDEDEEKKS